MKAARSQHILMKSTSLLLPCFLVFSCSQPPVEKRNETSTAPQPPAADANKLIVPDLARPSIDASQLSLTSLSIARQRKSDGTEVGTLYISAPGDADYVEIRASYLGGGTFPPESLAPEKVIRNRYMLKAFPKGTVVVSARACVEPARAIIANVQCGPVRNENFTSNNVNQALLDLENELARKKAELAQLQSTLVNDLGRLQQQLSQCKGNQANAEKARVLSNVLSTFLSSGTLNVSAFFQPTTSTSDSGAMIAQNNLAPVGATLEGALSGTSSTILESFSGIASAIPLFKNSGDPVKAMSTFGTAIYDLFSADHQFVKECAEYEQFGFLIRIQALNQEISRLMAAAPSPVGVKQ